MNIEQIGPYRVLEKLGRSSRHQVYVAQSDEDAQPVALKLVNITRQVDRQFAVKRIQLEAKILKRLDHPHLVHILDADIVDHRLYFAMELVDGEPLSALLSRRGKLAWDLAVDITLQIAQALEYLHRQDLLHLKLTPDKILIGPQGFAKLTDMRVNRARKRRWDDHRARVLDTAAYLAPEFLTGDEVTEKCDIYSLGVILFEMIAGKMPFEPETLARLVQRKKHRTPPRLSSLVPECPVWIDRLVAQMISGDPAKRPHTMHGVVLSLQEAQRMDATQMSVTQRMASGFNPITAGKDNKVAKRLLGVKDEDEQRTPIDWTPFLLVAGLTLVFFLMVGGLIWVFRPLGEDQLLARGKALVEQSDNLGLAEAKTQYLEPLLERFPDGEHAREAQQLLDEADRRLALQRMKINDKLNREPRSEGEASNLMAWRSESAGDLEAAYWQYQQTVETVTPEGRNRGHVLVAEAKLEELQQALVEDPLAPQRIAEHLVAAESMVENGDTASAQDLLQRVVALYGGEEALLKPLEPLAELWQQLQTAAPTEAAPPETNENETPTG